MPYKAIAYDDSNRTTTSKIQSPECLKRDNCTQEQLVDFIYILNLEKIDDVANNTNIWIVLTIISIISSLLPISNIIFDLYKKRG